MHVAALDMGYVCFLLPGDALSSLDFVPPMHSGPLWGFVFGVAILGVGAGSAVAAMLVRAWSMRSLQAHEHEFLREHAAQALIPGPGRVVHGVVETDEQAQAVRVEVVQKVTDHSSKNSRWHTWDEVSRNVRSSPFYVKRDDGEIVHVEPDQDVLVVDALTTEYPQQRPQFRLRIADVHRGERIYAYGDLVRAHHPRVMDGGYRGGGTGFVLRPRARGRLLVATDAVKDRYAKRISFLRNWGLLFAVAWIAFTAASTGQFLALALLGQHEMAAVTSHRTFVTTSKNTSTTHYVLGVRAADDASAELEAEVPRETYADVTRSTETPPSIPMTRLNDSIYCLGNKPSLHVAWLVVGCIAFLLTWIFARIGYTKRVPWYDVRVFNEDGGKDHWREPRPGARVRESHSES